MKRRSLNKLKYSFIVINILAMFIMMKLVGHLSGYKTTCLFDALGFKCLGCNILAALYQLSRGELRNSYKLNPLIFIWLGVILVFIVDELKQIIYTLIKHQKHLSLLDRILLKMFKGMKY